LAVCVEIREYLCITQR